MSCLQGHIVEIAEILNRNQGYWEQAKIFFALAGVCLRSAGRKLAILIDS
jgi:hypothetical protein